MKTGKIYRCSREKPLFTSRDAEFSNGEMPKNSLFIFLDFFQFFESTECDLITYKILFKGKIYYIDVFEGECILYENT